jgi:hypothetical protein
MIAYACDVATRRNPVGFFGMVFVLEGTSVSLASRAADRIQAGLQITKRCCGGLYELARSQGSAHGSCGRHRSGHPEGIAPASARVLLTGRDAAVLQAQAEPWDLQAQHCRSTVEPAMSP